MAIRHMAWNMMKGAKGLMNQKNIFKREQAMMMKVIKIENVPMFFSLLSSSHWLKKLDNESVRRAR